MIFKLVDIQNKKPTKKNQFQLYFDLQILYFQEKLSAAATTEVRPPPSVVRPQVVRPTSPPETRPTSPATVPIQGRKGQIKRKTSLPKSASFSPSRAQSPLSQSIIPQRTPTRHTTARPPPMTPPAVTPRRSSESASQIQNTLPAKTPPSIKRGIN